jgi:hypothetical protein
MKKILIQSHLFFIIIFLSAGTVFAAEKKFFEFAPDAANGVYFYNRTLYQPFQPNNDYVSGVDVWLDNVGDAGTAVFGLLDKNGDILASKNASIPYTPKTWGGKVFHVEFSDSFNVVSKDVYKIKITSAMPDLEIYSVSKVQLLSHNEAYPVESFLDTAFFGAERQNFSLKLALYENNDVLAPNLSNVAIKIISQTEAKIEFNANEPIDYKIGYSSTQRQFSTSTEFNGVYSFCNEGVALCSLKLSVFPDSHYDYELAVKDSWGNESRASGSFESASSSQSFLPIINNAPENQQPLPPPLISNFRAVSLIPNSTEVAWTTDKAANSSLLIASDAQKSKIVSLTNSLVFELEHLMSSAGALIPLTKYYASISSSDSSGNSSSQNFEFTTPKETQPAPVLPPPENKQTPPQVNNPSELTTNPAGQAPTGQPANAQTQTPAVDIQTGEINAQNGVAVVIKWQAPAEEPSDGYRVDIFNDKNELVKQISVKTGVHEIKISDLDPGNYRAIIYANNHGVFERVAQEIVFSVPKKYRFFLNPFLYGGFALVALIAVSVFLLRKKFRKIK